MSRKMKDSGIEWIGEIPENFIMIKTKYLCNVRNGLTYSPTDLCNEDEGVLVLRSSNIKDGALVFEDNVYVSCEIKSELMVNSGDILLCSRNGSKKLIGKNAIIENDLNASFGAFMMIVRGTENPKYMYYILNSNIFSYYLGTFLTATINQLTGANFSNMVIPYCKDEKIQNRIVAYLDKKCSQIDTLISNQQKQIEKLKTYKQSLITEAVTKGLNPDVEMKDSGVEWIGEIPKEWNCLKLKFATIVREEKYIEGDYEYIALENIESFSGQYVETKSDYTLNGTKIAYKDDVIFGKLRPYLGKVLQTDVKVCVSSEFVVFSPQKVLPKYLKYFLLNNGFIEIVTASTYGTKMPRANTDFIKNQYITVPPIIEQEKIINKIDVLCNKVQKLISIKQQKIEKLNEYKKSVIYEYVTGKKEA